MDIKDFFPSLTTEVVHKSIVKLTNKPEEVAIEAVETFFMYGGILPQGAPTSPFVADLVMREFDHYLRNYINKYMHGATYLRYIDNFYVLLPDTITEEQVKKCIGTTIKKLADYGLELNHKKTKLMTRSQSMEILGLTSNPVPEVIDQYAEVVDNEVIVKKRITTYRTMRVSRKYCEATFRELCDIYKLEKIGIRVDTSKYLSAIGKVQYAKLNNGRLKKGFRIIAEQLLNTSQNENSKILHRLIVGGEKAVKNDDTH